MNQELLERIERMAKEDLIPISHAHKHFPVKTTQSNVSRWTSHGVVGVKLETFRQGGLIYTSKEAIDRFMEAINE